MRHIPIVAKLAYPLAHLLALCGCGDSAPLVSVAPDNGSLVLMLALEDVDLSTYQPALIDDFGKKTGSVATPNRGETEPKPVAVVLVYGPAGCDPCKKATTELNLSRRFDARHADITPHIAKIAADWNQGAYPIVTFRDKKGEERFIIWRDLKDFEIRYNRTMGKTAAVDTRMPPSNASGSMAAVLYYHGQSSSWTWPGNLRHHLVNEHGYSANQVAGMSDRQVISAHDAAHSGTAVRAQAAPRVRFRARASGCPNGVCPL